MAFTFNNDQEQFRDNVARFCQDKSPATSVRTQMASERGFDPSVWQQMCSELGLVGLHIPEAKGGSGFSAIELGIVMQEMGRSLMCAPYFASSVLAVTALAETANDEHIERWMPGLMEGAVIGALAISEANGQFAIDDLHTTATPQENIPGAHLLNGEKHFVVDGHNANLILVAANTNAGAALFAVEVPADGLQAKLSDTMDATRKLAQLTFQNTPAQYLGPLTASAFTRIYDIALVALANEMVGGAQALLDAALDYTKLRVQFGRTIGSFQAIKHRLADLLLEVEHAKSAAYQAAQLLAAGDDEATAVASMAKAAASDAYLNAGIACIQLHGGIGFTWENDTHLWFKRAKSSEVFLGTPNQHRERMLCAMGV
jgi:alkylation response protein AidB-like acyl-CoA dehydrogenase